MAVFVGLLFFSFHGDVTWDVFKILKDLLYLALNAFTLLCLLPGKALKVVDDTLVLSVSS